MNKIKNYFLFFLPKFFKKKLRHNYHKYLEKYIEKVKFFNCTLATNKIFIKNVFNKNGIEIGGPSFFFRNFITIYDYINNLDNVNFSNRNIWSGKINESQPYIWGSPSKKIGKQFINCSTNLTKINNDKYDFLLSSHQLEHVANPIKALNEFRRVLKPSGKVILILPYSKYNFDRKRPITTFEHLLSDFKKNIQEDDLTHLQESLDLTDFAINETKIDEFKNLAKNNYLTRILHHHVFDEELVFKIFDYVNIKILNFEKNTKKFPSLCFLGEKN